MQREVVRLIETAAVFTPRMQGYRNHGVGVAQYPGAALAHDRAEARCNRAPAIVFQGVNDVLHPSVIGGHGRRPADDARCVEVHVERRREPNAGPAYFAHRSVQRMTEWY